MARAKQVKITVVLTPADKVKLFEYAQAANKTPSAVARDALRFFLENKDRLEAAEWEGLLERRVRRMEDRLAGLMAKLARASAQNLYFTMTPFIKGGWPEEALPPGAFKQIWAESRQFAADWLKKVRNQEIPESEVEDRAETA